METYFNLDINGHQLELRNMNISGPKLFSVIVDMQGKKERFHLHGDGTSPLTFALPETCPKFLLEIEQELSERIFELYKK